MVTKERFAQGMTFQQYLDQMTTNKDKFLETLAAMHVTPQDRAALRGSSRASSTCWSSPRTGAGTR